MNESWVYVLALSSVFEDREQEHVTSNGRNLFVEAKQNNCN